MITCIFGKRGSGKTTLARGLLDEAPRAFICDPFDEYLLPDTEKFYSIAALARRMKENLGAKAFRYCFYPVDIRDSDKLLLLAHAVRYCTVVLEEIDLLCSPNFIPLHLSESIRRGRHYGVDLIAVSRRPAEVSRLLTSQASRFYIFRFSEPRDLEYFAATFGDETAIRIRALKEHEYIVKDL